MSNRQQEQEGRCARLEEEEEELDQEDLNLDNRRQQQEDERRQLETEKELLEEFNSNLRARRRELNAFASKLDQRERDLGERQEDVDEQAEELECQQTNLQATGMAYVTFFIANDWHKQSFAAEDLQEQERTLSVEERALDDRRLHLEGLRRDIQEQEELFEDFRSKRKASLTEQEQALDELCEELNRRQTRLDARQDAMNEQKDEQECQQYYLQGVGKASSMFLFVGFHWVR